MDTSLCNVPAVTCLIFCAKLALPLIKTHGFTREALSLSVLSLPTPLTHPLPDVNVTALFGPGDDAYRTLVHAWLDDARHKMKEEVTEKM
ncbi:hypothetical protein EV424DRAFT_634556 [Suillus variegatus]|nr:hypothetical protein EV424DRAFT_634556 [Suillus variegatus]